MANTLEVNVVSADQVVWSGEATFIVARTVEGEIGILPEHVPVLSLLDAFPIEITPASGEKFLVSVDGGLLSVAHNRVSIVSEHALIGKHDFALADQDA